jgi:hypothetical protein
MPINHTQSIVILSAAKNDKEEGDGVPDIGTAPGPPQSHFFRRRNSSMPAVPATMRAKAM